MMSLEWPEEPDTDCRQWGMPEDRSSLPPMFESVPTAVAELPRSRGIRRAASRLGMSLAHCVTFGKTLNLSGP